MENEPRSDSRAGPKNNNTRKPCVEDGKQKWMDNSFTKEMADVLTTDAL